MRFGKCLLTEAEGGLLVHTIKVDGKRWSKGRQLSADDIAALRAAGVDTVTVGHLEPDDTHEDSVADALARAMAGDGVDVGRAFTGRCNLYAAEDGVAALQGERLTAFNHIDEALTVATLPPFEQVRAGQMLATIKVIPFAVPTALLEHALEHLDKPAVRVARYHRRRFGLLMTRLPVLKDSLLEKGERGIRQRLAGLGCELATVQQCDHDEDAIAEALQAMADTPLDGVLVLAASAITDRRDVIPAALTAAGGTIERFGMPVDPGNLLLLGGIGTLPVVGLPGCARSPKINGLDWVLRRLATDLPLNARVIASMGIGGLLQETSERPQLREPAATAQRKPRVAAVVLAAGHSRRMGDTNKLLATWQDKTLIQHSVDTALASGASPVYVITGHEGDCVASALTGRDVVVVHNPEHEEGLASSLRAAARALPESVDAMLVCLGDMPRVAPADLDQLIAAFSPQEGRAICIPTYQGKRGNPVLLGRQFFPEIAALEGDRGARTLIRDNADVVAEVPVDRAGILMDIDTPAALEGLANHPAP